MTKFWDEYHLPASAQDAAELLSRYDGRARVIAGGTDLLLDLKDGQWAGERPHYAALIDVTRIAGACEIRESAGWVVVGCGVTHTALVASTLVQTRATALAEACSVVGGPQVRNVATLVGNIAHALPAADGLIALLVLGAQAQIVNCASRGNAAQSTTNEEWRPLDSLYRGPGKSTVDPTREFIAAIRFRPTVANEASACTRVMRPQGIALPILGMAARVKLNSAQAIDHCAISAGPVAPLPFRATKTEVFLRGKTLNGLALASAAQVLLSEVSPRTSPHRATKDYRLELLPAMLRTVLTRAVERAQSK